MDAVMFAAMFHDKNRTDLEKMKHKYSAALVEDYVDVLKRHYYTELPLLDFRGNLLVRLSEVPAPSLKKIRPLLELGRKYGDHPDPIPDTSLAEEIRSTLAIENIAPVNQKDVRIGGIRKGLEFISQKENAISEENLFRLYEIAIADGLEAAERLKHGNWYRHDAVWIAGGQSGGTVYHQGLPHEKLNLYMKQFLAFILQENWEDDLLKGACIHFYLSYLHPWFDGNGRMARLLHLWFLVQRGYSASLSGGFSRLILESRKKYYAAYQKVEHNSGISGLVDVTPFLTYFTEHVYNKVGTLHPESKDDIVYEQALSYGEITQKEAALWNFVLSRYRNVEFSTKQLEKDYGQAAYATIRGFVQKFESLGLLTLINYKSRPKYKIN